MNILVIDAKVLTPTQDGRSVRMLHFLKILIDLGHTVTFVGSKIASWPPFDQTFAEDVMRMETAGIKVLCEPDTPSVEYHLEQAGRTYDVVLLSGLFVTDRHIRSVRLYAPQAAIIYDTVDLVHVREFRQAKLLRNGAHLKKAMQLKQVETALTRLSDATIVVSETEKTVLEGLTGHQNILVISNIHEVDPTATPFAQRKDMLFVGGFQHRPNSDAAIYFVSEIMPLLRRDSPGIKLVIIGSAPTDEVLALHTDDVIVLGHVEDLRPYFEQVRLSIAPLRFGAGVKGKVLASMGYGVPTVISAVAAEGMAVVHGHTVQVANTAENFSAAVQELYQNEAYWLAMRDAGIEHIRHYYSIDAARQQIHDMLDSLKVMN